MKTLYLLLLLSSISIHAMDDLEIVPFNEASHFDTTRTILTQAVWFPEHTIRDPGYTTTVLVRPIRQTRSRRYDEVLGAIVCHLKQSPAITKTYISLLAVAQQHQRKGYGRMLMRHIESIPTINDHLINIGSRPDAESFYAKLGYTKSAYYTKRDYYMEKIIKKNAAPTTAQSSEPRLQSFDPNQPDSQKN